VNLLQDIHYGWRTAWKSPGFSLVIVLTLALGIGANTAIFTLVNSMVLQPLPYPESDELVLMNETSRVMDAMSVSYLNFLDWREQNQTFEALAAYDGESFTLSGIDRTMRVRAAQVSAGFFEILGERPFIGRTFEPSDDTSGSAKVAVLPYGLWASLFGGEQDILSRTILLDGESYQIIGVMPPGFDFFHVQDEPGLYVPIGLNEAEWTNRGNHTGITVLGRLKDGVTIETARVDMAAISRRLEEAYPASNTGNGVRMRALYDVTVQDMRTPLLILLASVGCVLLIACFNIANLLLARAAARRPEIAVRTAIGASRSRVARQLLTESLLLSMLGGVAGIFFGFAATRGLLALLPANVPRAEEVAMDWRVLLFTTAICFVTGLVFGLAPAVAGSRVDLSSALKEGGRGGAGRRNVLRHALIVSEMAVAVMLLVGAALLLRSFYNVIHADPGFDSRNTLVASFSMPETDYPENHQQVQFVERLLESVQSLPGVESAGVATPLLGSWQRGVYVEGAPIPQPGSSDLTDYGRVTPDYLPALGVPLVRGRYFDSRDRENSAPVVVVDQVFADRYWKDDNPIGKRVKLGRHDDPDSPWFQIVGVVGHVKNYGVDQESRMELYLPYYREPIRQTTLVLRASTDPGSLVAAVTDRVRALDAEVPLYNVSTMEELLGESFAASRMVSVLLGVFAVAALLLAAIGLYGLMSYTVARSYHEIGVRMALGAGRGRVLGGVVAQGSKLVAAGLVIGLAASYGLARLLESQLFGVAARDAASFVAVAGVLAVVAAIATYIPARRAAAVDPIIALRYE